MRDERLLERRELVVGHRHADLLEELDERRDLLVGVGAADVALGPVGVSELLAVAVEDDEPGDAPLLAVRISGVELLAPGDLRRVDVEVDDVLRQDRRDLLPGLPGLEDLAPASAGPAERQKDALLPFLGPGERVLQEFLCALRVLRGRRKAEERKKEERLHDRSLANIRN